jgi:hypothetical protein
MSRRNTKLPNPHYCAFDAQAIGLPKSWEIASVTKKEFIEQLLSQPLGLIIGCNIVDGFKCKQYSAEFIHEILDAWHAFHQDRGASSDFSAIKDTIEQYHDGSIDPDPAHAHHRCTNPAPSAIGEHISTVREEKPFHDMIDEPDREFLYARYRYRPTKSALAPRMTDSVRNNLRASPDKERRVQLRADAVIPPRKGPLWVTQDSHVKSVIRAHPDAATNLRDRLGLVHFDEKALLVTLHFEDDLVEPLGSNRYHPTFADAAIHSRFRAPGAPGDLAPDGWGRTVDLSLLSGGKFVYGLPEAVCRHLSGTDTKAIVVLFTPIGRPANTRGGTSADDDSAFAAHLAAGRSTADILAMLLS